jgi:hypothetical protein
MRNLMGRLNTRSDEELQRIAMAWLLPGTARDRAALIAQLMRTMTDLRAVRDFWTRRTPDEQDLIAWFVANGSDQGATINELSSELGQDEGTIRAIATKLYQAGALASTARQQPMAVGEIPRLFLTRELGQLFARIQDERDAGDFSNAAPSALLELLDDGDIQRAAELWGLESMPGLRTRRELSDGLLELTVYPDRRAGVERKLGWDARRMLAAVAELPAGQTVPITEIADELELDPSQPRTAERLRIALGELEEALLVWHVWLPDDIRALFQPIWQPIQFEQARDRQHPPEPISVVPVEPTPKHPSALAWDLLTFLRWLGAGTPAVAHLSSAAMRARRRLDAQLWNRGGEEPLPGYLEFLAALADRDNLLDPPDADTRANKSLRLWRDRSFDDQTSQLISWWLGAGTWIEAQDQEEVVVSGAHWPQFRRRLLVLLPELDSERWYRLDELARWLSHRSSDSLGDGVQIATSRPVDASLDRSAVRLASLEHVVERTLRSGFAWFGLVEIGHVPSIGEVARITAAGLRAAGVGSDEPNIAPAEPAIAIHPDLTVTLRNPTPVRVWSLTAFADQIRLEPEADYRVTNRSLKRALSAGFRVEDVITFLERQAGEALDGTASAQLRAWAETLGRVWMSPALVIQAEQDEETRGLRAPLQAAGFRTTPQVGGLLVEGAEGISAAALVARVEAILQEQGKTPQFRTPQEGLPGGDQTDPADDPATRSL